MAVRDGGSARKPGAGLITESDVEPGRPAAGSPIRRSDGAGMAEVLGPRRLPHYGSPVAGAAAGMMGSMIGRMHYVVVDCPDPAAVAGWRWPARCGSRLGKTGW